MAVISQSPAGFPMAPSEEVWNALTADERADVVEALPGEVTDAEIAMPEGDRHFQAKTRALDVLRSHFARQRRRVYLAAELPIYYPAEPRFAPDLLAVIDAEDRVRDKWVVSAEGKGLDWVLEVHVGGDRKKDAEHNVARYARLRIPEYFLYDREKNQLFAYRLSPGGTMYIPIVPQAGRYESRILGLEVEVTRDRLRFFTGTTMLLESEELIARLEQLLEEVQQRVEQEARLRKEETRRADEEARRRQEETRRRQETELEVARLREELARLKK